MNIKKTFINSIWGGIFIAIGALIFLSLYPSPLGAVLFSIGLMMIFVLKLNLYTGIVAQLNRENFITILIILLTNAIGCCILFLFPQNEIAATLICTKTTAPAHLIFIRSALCGMIITSCVFCYQKGYLWAIFALIPTFILAGFEHSIADICLVILGRSFTIDAIKLIVISILGNACGSICLYRSIQFWR